MVALAATAFAWQRYMKAFLDTRLSLPDAVYQICVMQIGKYVPIMIGGFLARISANTRHLSAERIVVATTVEQIGAMGAALVIGADCYVLVRMPAAAPFAIAGSVLVAWFAPSMFAIALRLFARLRSPLSSTSYAQAREPGPAMLRQALGFQLVQMMAMAGFLGIVIAQVFPEMPLGSGVLVTGSYLISVVVGIAVVFLPGGIGAREAAFIWLASAQITAGSALQLALALRIAMSVLDLAAGAICAGARLWATHRERRQS